MLSKVNYLLCYDGHCLLCDGFIRFLLKKDKSKKLFFCTLQSELTQRYLARIGCEDARDLKTVVYVKNGKPFIKSSAVIQVLTDIGGGWQWVAFFLKLVPFFLRDFMYQLVSKYRYKIFGKSETCYVPNEAEKERYLGL